MRQSARVPAVPLDDSMLPPTKPPACALMRVGAFSTHDHGLARVKRQAS